MFDTVNAAHFEPLTDGELQRRVDRDGVEKHHITVFTAKEMKSLKKRLSLSSSDLLQMMRERLFGRIKQDDDAHVSTDGYISAVGVGGTLALCIAPAVPSVSV